MRRSRGDRQSPRARRPRDEGQFVNIAAALTLKSLRSHRRAAGPYYRDALVTACRKAPPPFGTKNYEKIYRDVARDPNWMALSLIQNAQGEGEGSGHLWDLAASTPDAQVAAQIKIAEIRTLVHHIIQRPMLLAYCAPERRRRLALLHDRLRVDEARHIGYTATLIEEFAQRGKADAVKRLMQERMSDFNAITNEDLGRGAFEP